MHLVFVLLFAVLAGGAWAAPDRPPDPGPTSWGALKAAHIDQHTDLDLAPLQGAQDAAGKPLYFEGTFRAGNYRVLAFNWLTVPLVVTRYESRLRNAAWAVGIGKFTFAEDGERIFSVIDVLEEQTHNYTGEGKKAVILFTLEAVGQAYKWNHRGYGAGTAEYHGALRLAVDMWWFEYVQGRRAVVPP